MRIVVLGATGGTGREVVEQALDAGHEVVAFVRDPDALPSRTGRTVIRGNLDDVAGLTDAVTGADALICCIGPKDPMDFIRGDLVHRAMRTAIVAMRAAGVDRLVLMSALGAGDTAPITPASMGLPARTVMRAVYGDKEKAEAAVAASGLDARIVYPVILTKGRPTGKARLLPITADADFGSLPMVARSDVAALLIDLALSDQAADTRFVITG